MSCLRRISTSTDSNENELNIGMIDSGLDVNSSANTDQHFNRKSSHVILP